MIQHDAVTDDQKRIFELEKELGLYKNVISGANLGIWEWNVQTGEQTINDRWAEMLGYTMEELAPISIDTWRNLLHPGDLELAEKKVADTFSKSEKYYSLTFRMKHKDGHWVWIESNGAVNSWAPDGNPLLISGSHVDITLQKKNGI